MSVKTWYCLKYIKSRRLRKILRSKFFYGRLLYMHWNPVVFQSHLGLPWSALASGTSWRFSQSAAKTKKWSNLWLWPVVMRKTSGLEEPGHILRQRTRTLHEERASVNLRLQKETAKSSLALSEFYFVSRILARTCICIYRWWNSHYQSWKWILG